ncbi:hypothetical protein TREES_T100005107 [Tupaia chinensis]|uniref:Uncharacterized protein n=1 Tax=Tupaia chinensis TaxID=246437 RepID=L9L1J1_TUPCH|nr:hypothetical protein TREES_T100005107 [Tupaia chinensis]
MTNHWKDPILLNAFNSSKRPVSSGVYREKSLIVSPRLLCVSRVITPIGTPAHWSWCHWAPVCFLTVRPAHVEVAMSHGDWNLPHQPGQLPALSENMLSPGPYAVYREQTLTTLPKSGAHTVFPACSSGPKTEKKGASQPKARPGLLSILPAQHPAVVSTHVRPHEKGAGDTAVTGERGHALTLPCGWPYLAVYQDSARTSGQHHLPALPLLAGSPSERLCTLHAVGRQLAAASSLQRAPVATIGPVCSLVSSTQRGAWHPENTCKNRLDVEMSQGMSAA